MNAIGQIAPPTAARTRKRRSIADLCRRLKAVEAEIDAIIAEEADLIETKWDFWNRNPVRDGLMVERNALIRDLVCSSPQTDMEIALMADAIRMLIDTEGDPSSWSICEPLVVGAVLRVLSSAALACLGRERDRAKRQLQRAGRAA